MRTISKYPVCVSECVCMCVKLHPIFLILSDPVTDHSGLQLVQGCC